MGRDREGTYCARTYLDVIFTQGREGRNQVRRVMERRVKGGEE